MRLLHKCNASEGGIAYIVSIFQAQWLSWLERRPVTAEVTSSSLVWVVFVCKNKFHIGRAVTHRNCRHGGIGRRPGLKIPWEEIPVPVRPRLPALRRNFRNEVPFLIWKRGKQDH